MKVALLFIKLFSFSFVIDKYCGHSMGVIPGLVSIPVVKSFCVLFVYYGFLWEFHFAASLLYTNFTNLLIIFSSIFLNSETMCMVSKKHYSYLIVFF